jgi:hypothetical protein
MARDEGRALCDGGGDVYYDLCRELGLGQMHCFFSVWRERGGHVILSIRGGVGRGKWSMGIAALFF